MERWVIKGITTVTSTECTTATIPRYWRQYQDMGSNLQLEIDELKKNVLLPQKNN